MAGQKDLYEILGVSKDSSAKDIKSAYRKLVAKHHPDKDKSDGAADRFKEIQNAYEILSDEGKRAQYDRYGDAGLNQGAAGFGQGGYGQGMSGAQFGDFGDLSDFFDQAGVGGMFGSMFGEQFGSGGGATGPQRGSDLETIINIELEDAVEGSTKTISYDRKITCDTCDGTGSQNKKTKTCDTCSGAGRVQQARQTMLGQMVMQTKCPTCQGLGEVPEEVCKTCNGDTILQERSSVNIKVPKGTYDDMTVKFAEKGNAGRLGGEYGDLYVTYKVKEHKLFIREGDDILIQFRVPLTTAVLGGEIEVPTLYGDQKLKVPSGTQYGEVLNLKGKGMPKRRDPDKKGDENVKIVFDVPKPNKRERKLWEQLNN